MDATIDPVKGVELFYALIFHCQTSQEDVLHPGFLYRWKEIHSSIQSLFLSPTSPFFYYFSAGYLGFIPDK